MTASGMRHWPAARAALLLNLLLLLAKPFADPVLGGVLAPALVLVVTVAALFSFLQRLRDRVLIGGDADAFVIVLGLVLGLDAACYVLLR